MLPVVVSYLRHRFGAAVPMYYWSSREGNTISREIHESRHVRMLALFARRPKLVSKQAISGKLNAELFHFANKAELHGVPTFAGFPVVRDLFELCEDFRTLWFPLTRIQPDDVVFNIDLTMQDPTPISHIGCPIRILNLVDLGDAVTSAKVLSWSAAIATIREVRVTPRTMGGMYWGGSTYNPVYVLVPA